MIETVRGAYSNYNFLWLIKQNWFCRIISFLNKYEYASRLLKFTYYHIVIISSFILWNNVPSSFALNLLNGNGIEFELMRSMLTSIKATWLLKCQQHCTIYSSRQDLKRILFRQKQLNSFQALVESFRIFSGRLWNNSYTSKSRSTKSFALILLAYVSAVVYEYVKDYEI